MGDQREYTEEDLDMLRYFYTAKGDHARYSGWVVIKASVKRDFPKLFIALDRLREAEDSVEYQFSTLYTEGR